MTVVENLTPRVQYNYISEQQEYPITFPYIERQYVKCMVGDVLLTYNIDYQVPAFDQESLDENELYLTLLITPTVGDVITIYRETSLDQQAEFPQTAKFSSQKITEALDKLTQQQQEQQDDINTCLRLAKNIPVDFNTELPEPAANQVIQWNEDGTQLINYDLRSEIQTIDTKANTAISTANTAESKADTAISTANTATTKANNAISTANDAVNTANTASTNASNAVSTANDAVNTANTASTNASNAVSTANDASSTATNAKNKVDALEENIETVIEAAGKINELEEAVTTATNAATTASTAADTATQKAQEISQALNNMSTINDTSLLNGGNINLQVPLVSGTNIKTINNNSILGSGNLTLDGLPSQSGQSGKFLTTDGSNPSWADVDALPSQTGQSGKFLTTDGTDASWATVTSGSSRNIGEIVESTLPLTDAGLHLLDGSLITYGSYQAFVDYIADIYDSGDYPDLFCTESDWQQQVTNYGACGKFVYDSVNNTVRLPKITGILEGTTDLTALGVLVEAGLPNITGRYDCDMLTYVRGTAPTCTGAFYSYNASTTYYAQGAKGGAYGIGFNASNLSSIYGNSSTVQPQTIKVLYYIVIATSTKTQIEVDIDEIATDLNGKADTNLSNLSSTGQKVLDGQWEKINSVLAKTVSYPSSNDITYSLEDVLPDDIYNYEVLFSGAVTTGSSSGNYIYLQLKTDILTSALNVCGIKTTANTSSTNAAGLILPVGSARSVTVVANSSYNGTFNLYARGYRRIGTNT